MHPGINGRASREFPGWSRFCFAKSLRALWPRKGLQRKFRKPAAGGLAELERKAWFFAASCAAKNAPGFLFFLIMRFALFQIPPKPDKHFS
jgi:hypothetical protein